MHGYRQVLCLFSHKLFQYSVRIIIIIVTTTVLRNTTNSGELERDEIIRWKFTIPGCGVSFNLTVQQGDVVLYASTETTAPNEAIYQWRIEVSTSSNSVEVINIIPLRDNTANCSSEANVTVFTTIVGVNDTNMFTVSTNGEALILHLANNFFPRMTILV